MLRPRRSLIEMISRRWFYPLIAFSALGLAALLLLGYAAVIAYPRLPSVEALAAYQPKIPLQIYSQEGELIGEFGEERRAYVKIEDTPEKLEQLLDVLDEAENPHTQVQRGTARVQD